MIEITLTNGAKYFIDKDMFYNNFVNKQLPCMLVQVDSLKKRTASDIKECKDLINLSTICNAKEVL
jgi:hypothetical protein